MARQTGNIQQKEPARRGEGGDPKALTGVTKEPPVRRSWPVWNHAGLAVREEAAPLQGAAENTGSTITGQTVTLLFNLLLIRNTESGRLMSQEEEAAHFKQYYSLKLLSFIAYYVHFHNLS